MALATSVRSLMKPRVWGVALLSIGLVLGSTALSAPAHAGSTNDYVGTPDGTWWTDNGGDVTLKLMTQGEAYSDALSGPVFGGIGQQFTWSLLNGDLPAGISLSNVGPGSTAVTLSGTPTAAGAFAFMLKADTGEGWASLNFSGDVAPPTVYDPAVELTMIFLAGDLLADANVEVSGSGLKPGSTFTVQMFSTPVTIADGTVNSSGMFFSSAPLPPNTAPGAHRLLVTGIAPDNSVRTAQGWFSLGANGRIGAVSYTGPIKLLADTGAESAPLAAGALALVLAGVVLLRRRRAQA